MSRDLFAVKRPTMFLCSGGTFFARIQVDPAKNYAFVGFTNCGNGGKTLDDLIQRITGK